MEPGKMKNGRIILKAVLNNISPLGIGSGRDDHSDRDIVTTLYPFDDRCRILPPEEIQNAAFTKELPFIPATSFMGKISTLLNMQNNELVKIWGIANDQNDTGNASFIDCSDVLIAELPAWVCHNEGLVKETRDGIRLDSAKGTVAEGAKFDYELLAPGLTFSLTMIFRVETVKKKKEAGQEEEITLTDHMTILNIASSIAHIIEQGFDLGAKSGVGFGRMEGKAKLFELDFGKPEEFKKWVANELEYRSVKATKPIYAKPNGSSFNINATFKIKNSLIIRSYSKDPKAPDSIHLKSGGKNILSGSSIKGALRGRAERILNTIHEDEGVTATILEALFGDVEKEENNRQKVKKNGYTVPSRVFVDEVPIDEKDVKEEIQTRIQIDRFTGGTVDGALMEEVPLFPVNENEQIKNFRLRVNDAQAPDKGLMLLLLKDLWTADLPIGGEKSIGRGVLEGVTATITDGNSTYCLPDDFKTPEKVTELQKHVDALTGLVSYSYYHDRVEKFKNKKR